MAGRPSKYETHIKPYFKEIKEMLEKGLTEREIAKALHVAYSTYNKYKAEMPEFAELVKSKDMAPLISDLENALIRKALGFEYNETKRYIKKDAEGQPSVVYTEINTKYQPPSETAIFGALNRFDPNYKKDKAYYELKRQELELKKAIAKATNFDLEFDEAEFNENKQTERKEGE